MSDGSFSADQRINVQELWSRYEEIAIHFNDLLMKLRSQSLAVVAALATIVGIFVKEGGGGVTLDWGVAEALFVAMALFWIAIWCLDFFYYNRLLTGAVTALTVLENQCKPDTEFTVGIQMSTVIETEFEKSLWKQWPFGYGGVLAFYCIVFAVILAGIWYAHTMHG